MWLILALLALPVWAQTFEVASVRPAAQLTPQEVRSVQTGVKITSNQAIFRYRSLRDLVAFAYGVEPFQVVENQALSAGAFDILAKLPEGATKSQVPAMLRVLLDERFKLQAHSDRKLKDVYLLKQAAGGHTMTASVPPPAPETDPSNGFEMPGSVRGRGMRTVPMGATPADGIGQQWDHVSMHDLSTHLSPMLDRTVMDATALNGVYQVKIEVSLQEMLQGIVSSGNMAPGAMPPPPPGTASDPASSSIFASLKKLGLSLEKGRGEVQTIIVDHIELTPTAN